jgi:hypothetical protein
LSGEKRIIIAQFLKQFKQIAKIRGVYVIPRSKNKLDLIALGITEGIRETIILSLTPDDFCKGPEPDRDRPGDLWFFGKTENGNEIYIKLKIADANGTYIAKCLSFHRAGHKLKYFKY